MDDNDDILQLAEDFAHISVKLFSKISELEKEVRACRREVKMIYERDEHHYEKQREVQIELWKYYREEFDALKNKVEQQSPVVQSLNKQFVDLQRNYKAFQKLVLEETEQPKPPSPIRFKTPTKVEKLFN